MTAYIFVSCFFITHLEVNIYTKNPGKPLPGCLIILSNRSMIVKIIVQTTDISLQITDKKIEIKILKILTWLKRCRVRIPSNNLPGTVNQVRK